MKELVIRPYFVGDDGTLSDGAQDFSLESFGGVLPSVGDEILDPGVLQGLRRDDYKNREIWKVERRIFNPKDLENYVVLVCRVQVVEYADAALVP